MTRPIDLKSKFVFVWCLTGFLALSTILVQAQETPIQVEQFLNAFRGKPVGPISPAPAALPPTAPQTSIPGQSQMAGQIAQPRPSAEGQPICPPGIDRVGCTGAANQRVPTDCPAGMAPGPYGCVPTAMPRNAHRVSSDGRWQCDDGYLRFGAVCMSMQTPPNAHLTGTGSNWECNTGFRHLGNACVAINVPPNAHLADTWNGWACDSGYRSIGNWCVAQ